MFDFLKNAVSTVFNTFVTGLKGLFSRDTIDDAALSELEQLLIEADTGVETTQRIIQKLKAEVASGSLQDGQQLQALLKQQLIELLGSYTFENNADVFLLVGINGTGKTTFAAKLANQFKQQNKSVLLTAADTFRAAATEQLVVWAERLGVNSVVSDGKQPPSAVVYTGCERFKTDKYDMLIVDTAGRLQTKSNLMRELEKMYRIIKKQLPDAKICTLLTIDAMLGQNSFEQAQLFNDVAPIDGVVLTKMDGTGKGGIVFRIIQELRIPIAYLSMGEKVEQMSLFDGQAYVDELLN